MCGQSWAAALLLTAALRRLCEKVLSHSLKRACRQCQGRPATASSTTGQSLLLTVGMRLCALVNCKTKQMSSFLSVSLTLPLRMQATAKGVPPGLNPTATHSVCTSRCSQGFSKCLMLTQVLCMQANTKGVPPALSQLRHTSGHPAAAACRLPAGACCTSRSCRSFSESLMLTWALCMQANAKGVPPALSQLRHTVATQLQPPAGFQQELAAQAEAAGLVEGGDWSEGSDAWQHAWPAICQVPASCQRSQSLETISDTMFVTRMAGCAAWHMLGACLLTVFAVFNAVAAISMAACTAYCTLGVCMCTVLPKPGPHLKTYGRKMLGSMHCLPYARCMHLKSLCKLSAHLESCGCNMPGSMHGLPILNRLQRQPCYQCYNLVLLL